MFSGLFFILLGLNSFSQQSLFDQQMQVGFDEKQGDYAALAAANGLVIGI